VSSRSTNTRDTPIESLEQAFPLRVRRLALRRGSGGAGAHPGGEGVERNVEIMGPATISVITESWLLPAGDGARAEPVPDKCTFDVEAGDVPQILTPCGGGWGAPPIVGG
jgi:N-methylhydantoinase B/oxoprolinase/acetone carboxylase alpha subunit